jgi:hypothetical protein
MPPPDYLLNKNCFTKINTPGAHNRIRTGDLFLTKEVLYRLSYMSNIQLLVIRHPRQALVTTRRNRYPNQLAQLAAQALFPRTRPLNFGAGDGNRTHIVSLEG